MTTAILSLKRSGSPAPAELLPGEALEQRRELLVHARRSRSAPAGPAGRGSRSRTRPGRGSARRCRARRRRPRAARRPARCPRRSPAPAAEDGEQHGAVRERPAPPDAEGDQEHGEDEPRRAQRGQLGRKDGCSRHSSGMGGGEDTASPSPPAVDLPCGVKMGYRCYPAAFMRVLILGGDGYLGWPTAMRFSAARPRGVRRRQLLAPALGRGSGHRLPDPDPPPGGADRGLERGLRQGDRFHVGDDRGRRASSSRSSSRPGPRRSSTTASSPRPRTRWRAARTRSRPSTRT